MGAIAINVNKINNNIIPKLENINSDLQIAYSTSLDLKNNFPASNTKSYVDNIAKNIYDVSKKIKNVTINISDKADRAKQIEQKSENKISSLVSQIGNIGGVVGAIGGAVVGASTGLTGAIAGGVVGSKAGKTIAETGATVADKVVSGIKSIGSWLWNGIKSIGTGIANGVKSATNWISASAKKVGDWISNAFNDAKEWTCKAIKNTGAWISNAASAVWSGLKSAWNWITDGENWKKIGASFVNGVLSLVEGVVSLVESIGDFIILVGGGVATIGTALYDVGKGIVTGDWSFSTTSDWWKKCIVPVVTYDWTSALDESLGWRQYFDQWAFEPFKSDGMGCEIIKGVGYVAGVIVITIVTFGVGGVATGATAAVSEGVTATTMAVTATAAGVGKGTQEAWSQQITQTAEQEATKELQTIEITKEMYENKIIELQAQDSNREYTQEEIINAIYNDLYTEKMASLDTKSFSAIKEGARKLSNSQIAGGVAYGVGTGLVDGIQWYAGAKINTLFKGAGTKISNKLVASLIRVGADSVDAAAEVPIRNYLQTLYRTDENGNRLSFEDVWNENGGWRQVAVQAGIGALASGFGESLDAVTGAIATHKIVSALDNAGDNTDAVVSKQLSKLSDIDVKKLTDGMDDATKTALLKNMDGARFAEFSKVLSEDEFFGIAKKMDGKNVAKLANAVPETKFYNVIDNMLDDNDIVKAVNVLGNLDDAHFENFVKNTNVLQSTSDSSSFVKKMVDLYNDGKIASQTNYKNFFQNFREHGIGHSIEVAKYAEKIASTIDGVNMEETIYAALGHDFGMKGGLTYVDDELAKTIEAAGGPSKSTLTGKFVEIESLRGLDFGKDDFLDGLARSNHPLNSAIELFVESDLVPAGYDKDAIALLAMTHSKSTSGIKHFSNAKEWTKAVDKLDGALKQYNIDNGTNFKLDVSRLKEMIEDSDTFTRLQNEALAIRDGDAMAAVVRKNGGTLMQDGTISVTKTKEVRKNYNTPVLGEKEEYALIEDAIYDSSGTHLRDVDNSFSKKIHIGEENVDFDSSYIDGDYVATVKVVNPNQSPNATFSAIEERIGEVNTYTNCNTRRFEIVLPKKAKGTSLGDWYESTLENLKNKEHKKGLIFSADTELFDSKISEEIWNSQMNFYENLVIVYK